VIAGSTWRTDQSGGSRRRTEPGLSGSAPDELVCAAVQRRPPAAADGPCYTGPAHVVMDVSARDHSWKEENT
jgi:hypothetical protein